MFIADSILNGIGYNTIYQKQFSEFTPSLKNHFSFFTEFKKKEIKNY